MNTRMNFGKVLQGIVPAHRVGLAGATGSATADSLNPFTFAPGQVGLAGDTFTADNLVLSNNSTVRQTTASTFSDEGSFIVNAAQLVTSTSFVPHGLSSTYGLYIAFSGNGTTDSPGVDPAHKPTSSTVTDLSYTMYGYKGSASFGFQSDNAPTTSINGGAVMTPTSTPPLGAVVKLASGSFIQGFAGTSPSKPSFSPSGSLDLTLTTDYMNANLFADPKTSYDLANAVFSNTASTVPSSVMPKVKVSASRKAAARSTSALRRFLNPVHTQCCWLAWA